MHLPSMAKQYFGSMRSRGMTLVFDVTTEYMRQMFMTNSDDKGLLTHRGAQYRTRVTYFENT